AKNRGEALDHLLLFGPPGLGHGVANTHAAVDSAVAAANLVPGVKHVESAIQLVQEFTVIP
ncbi:MAG: Holliday junction branch migration DNA helicase RuvB, partial [Rectinemataceae bacterium]